MQTTSVRTFIAAVVLTAAPAHAKTATRAADPCKLKNAGTRLVFTQLEPDAAEPLARGQRVDLKADIGYVVPEGSTMVVKMMVLDPDGHDIWEGREPSPPSTGEGTASLRGHFWISSKVEGRVTVAAAAFKAGEDATPVAAVCRYYKVR